MTTGRPIIIKNWSKITGVLISHFNIYIIHKELRLLNLEKATSWSKVTYILKDLVKTLIICPNFAEYPPVSP